MQIKNLDPSSLSPYPNNSRTHTEEQITQVVNSITEFGFTNPVLIDEGSGIIAGHCRVIAAIRLGLSEIPTIELAGLSAAQKQAYVIADNQLAMNAGWDLDSLKLEIEMLKEKDFDLDLLGFDHDFLNDLLEEVFDGLTDEDACPEPPEIPVTVEGDLWILGNHRLMCGDSTSIDSVGRLMNAEIAGLVFTDPPYGIEYQSNMRTKSDKFDVLINDDTALDVAPIIEMFSTGWVFLWTSWKVQNMWISMLDRFGYPTNMVIWHKPGGGIGDLKRTFSSDYEVALVWHRGAELCGKRIGSVWTVGKDSAATYIHPTQKPVALSEEAIDKTTRITDIVLDLFGGSGSTLIGCQKSGRSARIMELDPKYCDVIVNRWQDFTGRKAVHENGKTFEELSISKSIDIECA